MFNLAGKVALVTGGNGGIGLGMARGLARAGAVVVIAGRNAEKSREAAHALRAQGARADAIEADVTDEGEVERLFAQVGERHGALHILVNNAGTTVRKPAHEMSLDEWRHVMDVNLTSAFLCCRSAHGWLRRQGGKVINIGSMMSIFGAPYAPSYGASKGGIVQFTRSIATAWAADGIQANAVLPGWIDTDLTRGAREQVAGLNERVLARTPAGRWGAPDDLAGIAVFLASPASDFVTGTAIPVDGGYSIT
ncbi:MAG TPA: glucose 1-dehydrogenase [Ramlibacter sp.]|jgi:2-deoxy-D-gluconate 3-dehydrogenase|uniref:SDR family NAD(P)-dependent oxidoreductase n=1 Tax=Ramlibacter sp. TaxID=1917967 RepID=UPI002D2406A8|nr:glucose 1-dehydrogenase [Ramlibacter sp.]HZY18698.1 glucose 1-dehydrogenase [Ramlibacter sp.]